MTRYRNQEAELRKVLLPWAARFYPGPDEQEHLIERVIAAACCSDDWIFGENIEAQFFKIMHELVLDDVRKAPRAKPHNPSPGPVHFD